MTTAQPGRHFPYISRVTPEIAAHVLWHFGEEGGYEPGSFTTRLFAAIEAADAENQNLLATIFPSYVEAWRLGKEWDCGISVLREIATRAAALR